jgi:hypothetical protein
MKIDEPRRWKRQIRLSLVIAFLVAPMLSCNQCGRRNSDKLSPSPDTPIANVQASPAMPEDPSRVSRVDANVALGPSESSLQPLTDNDWHKLRTGDHVTTDPNGEAALNILDCMTLYVFNNSGLVRSACSRSSSRGGSVYCAQEGTSLFNNKCGGKVLIETGSAEIQLEGTYLSVTYDPSNQLTLVIVLQGKVKVRPVTNFEERTLGEPIEVTEGNLFLSVPDNRKDEVSSQNWGVALRQPQPLDQIGDLIKPLGLSKWLDKIRHHAKTDGIAIPDGPPQSPSTVEINCDCENLDFGILTRPYRQQCRAAEKKLMEEFKNTGKVSGVCDPVASGPKATPSNTGSRTLRP